ncbi:hypothetical protein AYO21_02919 [Fonsecaea monophora]|uniref:Uncharacterized protein n=1 Tax=Fonsecaea monophora TaxID=254056 RepID=A0A177FFJ6_9EURO|nr:hypothetical protein AYO21_02919 [Fonsecaea monophora]KAH0847650.1 hypothetical protein FOPE_00887 [Fonsecaea pedrosoi]OAG42968.1 hypothetical protein AYO21_02919 [Fonsecaea monophora]
MVSVESTAAQAVSAVTQGPITSASPALLNLTNLRTVAADVTSSLSLPLAKNPLFRFPLRVASQIDRALLHVWNRFILEGLGISSLARAGTATAAGAAGAQAMADAAVQPGLAQAVGDAAAESWSTFFAEVFQATGFKSYWGMLHYLSSRWAFICFAVVRASVSETTKTSADLRRP